ncbi:metal-dependent transcriptional regulator [Sediminispirochaeta smaragdinae]|jgi:DtxR family Mn-dependent transcriptional regulator|uniref:Transcriptional regulator MntR n=1 Tax=Sediminispirochaeta smaragdinae (strain DSM 11293 / JCM 15392 / SEBR 4228) TaxID=573413 RepID=E1R8X3_SEDSS|nr:metal-dependent transcriptional regulator [Sediminispirochaeta smaragdinae]ADK81880.1 iron (metal) dependent repressor, DtxR family [Sediminispirochaeta smaragdinae DSM 11293]
MINDSDLSASLEDYLEAILILEKRNRVARVKEIAEALNVQMPSVSGALKVLRSRGLVHYEKNSYIRLTEEGMKVAKSIQDRHFALAGFLRKVLNLSADSAQDIACKIEHVITPELASRFRSLTQYIEDEVIANQMSRDSWETLISGHQTNDSDH